jgi:hypothetical protein
MLLKPKNIKPDEKWDTTLNRGRGGLSFVEIQRFCGICPKTFETDCRRAGRDGKRFFTQFQIPIKINTLVKNFTKGYHSVVTHVLYHFCDMSLITACVIFCSLKFHVVSTCNFFGVICLGKNSENDQDSDSN